MKILFIINPSAGSSGNEEALLLIHDYVAKNQIDFRFLYTSGQNDVSRIKQELDQYVPNRVVAAGGDGTIQLVARALVGNKIPMALLPLGSANGLATALNIPSKIQDSVILAFEGTHFRPFDLLKFDDEYYCTHLADIGINARMIKKYEAGNDSGMLGYAKHLLQSIKESPLLHYTIKTPEQTYHKEGYMMAFANAHRYGTGVQISEGSVSDGKFEVCNVERVALDAVIKAGLTRFNVFIDKDMFSDVISCTQAEIWIDQKTDFQIDGEYIGAIDHLKIEILASALTIIVSDHE